MYPWFSSLFQQLHSHAAHALLLRSPPGWGIDQLALSWSKRQLCEQSDRLSPEQDGCQSCSSCHMFEVKTHPDFFPLLTEDYALTHDWPMESLSQDQEKKKASRNIKISQVRALIEFAHISTSRQGLKIIWIHQAEYLTTEAANALLKTLEEPASHVRLILTSEYADSLMATLKSRCQHLFFRPDVHEEPLLAWLAEQAHLTLKTKRSSSDIAAAWHAGAHQPFKALQWLAHESFNAASWHQIPQQLTTGLVPFLNECQALDQLQILMMCLSDWQRHLHHTAPFFFNAEDFQAHVKPDVNDLAQWAHALLQEMKTIDHPFQPALSLSAWLAKTQAVLRPLDH